jgi:thiol-disulfide isomerase/thioredoxin
MTPDDVRAAAERLKDVRPSDFKGKWVVIDFWGFWCDPCVGRGLPHWTDFGGPRRRARQVRRDADGLTRPTLDPREGRVLQRSGGVETRRSGGLWGVPPIP